MVLEEQCVLNASRERRASQKVARVVWGARVCLAETGMDENIQQADFSWALSVWDTV